MSRFPTGEYLNRSISKLGRRKSFFYFLSLSQICKKKLDFDQRTFKFTEGGDNCFLTKIQKNKCLLVGKISPSANLNVLWFTNNYLILEELENLAKAAKVKSRKLQRTTETLSEENMQLQAKNKILIKDQIKQKKEILKLKQVRSSILSPKNFLSFKIKN
jgi:hypothetical protein